MHDIPGARMNGFQGNPLEMFVLQQEFWRQQQQQPFSAHSANDLIIWLFGVSVPCYKDVLFCFFTDNIIAERPEAP